MLRNVLFFFKDGVTCSIKNVFFSWYDCGISSKEKKYHCVVENWNIDFELQLTLLFKNVKYDI